MTDAAFRPGADVVTMRGRGTIIDVRATPSGKWVFGVEDVNGEVHYVTEEALRLAQSQRGDRPISAPTAPTANAATAGTRGSAQRAAAEPAVVQQPR